MIRLGQTVLAVGVAALLLPGPQALSLAGLVLVGLGCAPIYPSIIHSTPDHFGADRSQAVIGIQMASAYVGNLVMPGKQRCPSPLPRVSAGATDPDDRHARAAHPEDGVQINNFLTGGIFMLRIEYFDKDRFMRQVSASHGSVLLHLDNGKTCDLKEDATASSILRMMDAPRKGFDITVTDPADVTGFLRYMLEAGRMDRVAG